MCHTIWLRSLMLPLVLLGAWSAAAPTTAYDVWSADDPVVLIGGRLLDIQVQVPAAELLTMRSTTLTVRIPRNVSGGVVVDDVSAFPMHTIIEPTAPTWNGRGGLPITLVAEVTADTNFPIRLVATPLLALDTPLAGPTIAEGIANVPLRLPLTLGQ
jgi:hypothetical protein